MNNPLLYRHLSGSIRRSRFFVFLTLYLIAGGIMMLLSSSLFSSNLRANISMQDLFTQGRTLYWVTTFLLLVAVIIFPPLSAIGAIAGEHEHRTFELLRTTTLSSTAIVLGKMGSALMTGALYLFAPLPFVLIGFWLGGISLSELAVTFWVLALSMLMSTALALYISATSRKTSTATFVFYGLNFGSLPLIGVVSLILAFFNQAWAMSRFPALPLWIEGILQYLWIPITGLNPLSTAFASETLWLEHDSLFLITLPVQRYNPLTQTALVSGTILMPSPWIFFTVFALLATLLLLRLTIVEVSQPPRR